MTRTGAGPWPVASVRACFAFANFFCFSRSRCLRLPWLPKHRPGVPRKRDRLSVRRRNWRHQENRVEAEPFQTLCVRRRVIMKEGNRPAVLEKRKLAVMLLEELIELLVERFLLLLDGQNPPAFRCEV